MLCDFQNVTDTLMRNMSASATMHYNNVLNTLFGAFLSKSKKYLFERFDTSKLHSGAIRVSPKMSDFYLNADRSVLCKDIQELLPNIFDKPSAYKQFYTLIQYDESLSAPMRRTILNRVSPQYQDDDSLVNMIYEAVFIAVTRKYEETSEGFVALNYASDITLVGDALFSNSEYVAPCKHFCGRDAELDELHSLMQDHSCVIITGIAGIGKSELVRAYAQKHKSEYTHFGYYFYKGSLKTIIANIISNPVIMDEDLRYRKNLELLSSLGKTVLLIIDNINATPEEDECFDDLLELDCKIILTSHKHYDDLCTYELQIFRSREYALELIGKFYDYQEHDRSSLEHIMMNVGFHTYCIELCARIMSKGLYTPKTLSRKLYSGFRSIVERFSATKDKHSRKKTYYDHIKDLFDFMGLPAEHQNVLRMLIAAPFNGVRKDFIAKLMGLRSMIIIEDLIEVGLVQEFDNGTVTLQTIIRNLVKSELESDSDNCAPLIASIRAVCVNEALDIELDCDKMNEIIFIASSMISFKSYDDGFYFHHDCYKFYERFGITKYTEIMLSHEERICGNHNAKQKMLYLSDAASFEMMQGNQDKALSLQEDAVKHSRDCDDVLLQANTVNTYGYYLNLANRKEDALKAMQTGLALFDQLDGDGVFYYDKYRAIINYADLLFSLGQNDEAIRRVSAAKIELQDKTLTETEVYADCCYALGLYHLCRNDTSAGNDLVSAFRIFIDLYGRDSDFVQTRTAELQGYIENDHNGIMEYEPLKQLLGE
ncbi:ATP-binding protein [uncultured Ruminococcus sp.]|uniref:ATP-binding protein n=1 Tax=uncultured Ruminococcus sp. TaxID=165186 RepID=UPI0025EB7256|nr:ATP-binding protein [uncultured Ruminococcus sp.]